MAQNSYWVSSKLRSYFLCFWFVAYSSQGSGRRTLDRIRGLVTATSMARPFPSDHSGIDTSPGRRPEVGPRTLLLHHGSEHAVRGNAVDQVADGVVDDEVS